LDTSGNLTVQGNITAPNSTLTLGTNDTNSGHITLYGDNSTGGSRIDMYLSALLDSDFNYWRIEPQNTYTSKSAQSDALSFRLSTETTAAEPRAEICESGNIGASGFHTKIGSRLYWKSDWVPISWNGGSRSTLIRTPVSWGTNLDQNYIYQLAIRSFYNANYPVEYTVGEASAMSAYDYGTQITRVTSDGYVYISFGDAASMYHVTRASTANLTPQGVSVQLRVWDMGTPTATTGWRAVSTYLTGNTDIDTLTHNFGTWPTYGNCLTFIEWSVDASGTNDRICCNQPSYHSSTAAYQLGIVGFTNSTAYIKAGSSGFCAYLDINGTGRSRAYGTGYYRARMWKIDADYAGSYSNRSVNARYIEPHELGTPDVFVQPALSNVSNFQPDTTTEWCAFGSTIEPEGVHITGIDNDTIEWYSRNRHQCLYNRNNSLYNTGTAYVAIRAWK
jgi:hypothetical protein